jgi:maleylpyruvate isomerase
MILYGYPLSSASYRVRIALVLKGLEVTAVTKQLRRGEHRQEDYLRLNPQGFVPALELDDGQVLTQSLAIIEYLEENYPDPPLLPASPEARARVRALCQLITSDVHPLNNLRVLKYLEEQLHLDKSVRDAWYRHWIEAGFAALEQWLEKDSSGGPGSGPRLAGARPAGPFCYGNSPGMADACLVPQVFNARRFAVDLTPYPRIVAIDAACRELPAFERAAPERPPTN